MASSMLARQAGNTRWRIQADLNHPELLFDEKGLRLSQWLESGQATIVKQGQHRTVYRVILPEIDFHLKYYPLNNTRAWLRQVIRPSKARSEYLRTLTVARRGVPTLEPLAYGECGRAIQASYLISRTLPGVTTLESFLESDLPRFPGSRQRFIRQNLSIRLGQFVARMHHAGIIHHDLHPGNLLFRLDTHDFPHFYLIDLHTIDIRSTLDWTRSHQNLVLFNRWFIMRANRTDRLRFFSAYRQHRNELDLEGDAPLGWWQRLTGYRWDYPATAERDLEQQTWKSNLVFWSHHDYRCTAKNRYFHPITTDSIVGHAVTDLDPVFLQDLLNDPDAPFRDMNHMVLKDSPTSRVISMAIPGPDGIRHLVYKRFNARKRAKIGSLVLRLHPALRSYQMGHALRWRGLPTPRPLLVMLARKNHYAGKAYLLTEGLPEGRHLLHQVNQILRTPRSGKPLRVLIEQLARIIRRLHSRKMGHRDLKAGNIMVSPLPWRIIHPDRPETHSVAINSENIDPNVWLIDLVGVSYQKRISQGLRVKNLMRLNASFYQHPGITRTDRLRFLRIYMGWGIGGKTGWKVLWRQIRQATDQKIRRNRSLNRPLA